MTRLGNDHPEGTNGKETTQRAAGIPGPEERKNKQNQDGRRSSSIDITDDAIESFLGAILDLGEDSRAHVTETQHGATNSSNTIRRELMDDPLSNQTEHEAGAREPLFHEDDSRSGQNVDLSSFEEENTVTMTDRTKRRLLLRGIQCYQAAEYEDAIILFKAALRVDPESIAAQMMLGATFFQNRMYEEAITVYERLLQRDPDNKSARENLSHVYCVQGNFAAAATEWRQIEQGPPVELIQQFEKIPPSEDTPIGAQDESDRAKLIAAGVDFYRQRNYELAIRALKLATKFFPEADTFNMLGSAYVRNQNLAGAVAAYEQAGRFDNPPITTFENLAQLYCQQGAIDRAIDTWEKILRIDPSRSDIVNKIDEVIHLSD